MKLESRKEEPKDNALTTAALAHVDDRSASEREIDRASFHPSFHPGSEDPDRPLADRESRGPLTSAPPRAMTEPPRRYGSEADTSPDRASRPASGATPVP